ncbi:MAG: hypothetical protein RLZZ487_772 [Pseudomonadota bacterium]|jgi:hypothetical protein
MNRGRGQVVDQTDRLIATVPKSGAIPFEQREANLHLITAAPEIMAALLEAAYHLDNLGVPLRQELYDLINRVRGPEFKPLAPRIPTIVHDNESPAATAVDGQPKSAQDPGTDPSTPPVSTV